jgi:hypothetical protein
LNGPITWPIKRYQQLLAVVLLFLIAGSIITSVQAEGLKPQRREQKLKGVNYISIYHLYNTPDTQLRQEFARFQKDGITTIAILVFWLYAESAPGVYNQPFISNVIRICRIAASYGINVMIDFHTLIGDDMKWSTPEYVGVGMNLITNATIASAYVKMVKWAVGQLKVLPNIWAYSVVNEPWYWPLDEWRKTNWINLIVDLSNTVKAIDNRPVTVRFVAPFFERDFGWDSRLLSALDFVSVNAYVWPDAPYDIYWRTFDQYRNNLASLGAKAGQLGKKMMVTEYGVDTRNDTEQVDWYQRYMEAFRSTPNLMGYLNWGWDSGYDSSNPTFATIGDGWSMVNRVTGMPRPAYDVLTKTQLG